MLVVCWFVEKKSNQTLRRYMFFLYMVHGSPNIIFIWLIDKFEGTIWSSFVHRSWSPSIASFFCKLLDYKYIWCLFLRITGLDYFKSLLTSGWYSDKWNELVELWAWCDGCVGWTNSFLGTWSYWLIEVRYVNNFGYFLVIISTHHIVGCSEWKIPLFMLGYAC